MLLKLRKRYLFLLLLIFAYIILSNTFMKLRTSDEATKKYFTKENIAIKIHHQKMGQRSIRYIESSLSESPDQPLVIFVHGAPGSSDAFFSYLKDDSLRAQTRMIAIDRLGYGYSDYGQAETSIQKQAAAIRFVIDQHPATKVILVGHSFGGPIIAKCAMDDPTEISQLLFLAPVNDPHSEEIFWFSWFGKWKLTRWILSKALKVCADEKFSHIDELRTIESEWSTLKVPVIHMHGEKDNLASFANIDFSKKHIPNDLLKIITWPEGNHFIPWNKFEEVRAEILLTL